MACGRELLLDPMVAVPTVVVVAVDAGIGTTNVVGVVAVGENSIVVEVVDDVDPRIAAVGAVVVVVVVVADDDAAAATVGQYIEMVFAH
jgi:hypothetical protein